MVKTRNQNKKGIVLEWLKLMTVDHRLQQPIHRMQGSDWYDLFCSEDDSYEELTFPSQDKFMLQMNNIYWEGLLIGFRRDVERVNGKHVVYYQIEVEHHPLFNDEVPDELVCLHVHRDSDASSECKYLLCLISF